MMEARNLDSVIGYGSYHFDVLSQGQRKIDRNQKCRTCLDSPLVIVGGEPVKLRREWSFLTHLT